MNTCTIHANCKTDGINHHGQLPKHNQDNLEQTIWKTIHNCWEVTNGNIWVDEYQSLNPYWYEKIKDLINQATQEAVREELKNLEVEHQPELCDCVVMRVIVPKRIKELKETK